MTCKPFDMVLVFSGDHNKSNVILRVLDAVISFYLLEMQIGECESLAIPRYDPGAVIVGPLFLELLYTSIVRFALVFGWIAVNVL